MEKRSLLTLVVVVLLLSLACSAFGGGDSGGGDAVSTGGVDITIVNRSPDEVCYVLISPSNSDRWGDDQLGEDETIAPGDSRTFSMDDDTYDVRAESCDEVPMATAWEVAGDTTVTVGQSGADTILLIENDSDVDICYVFISPSTAEDWGEDWLGDMEQLVAGESRLFYVDGGLYDLQAADCDGETLTEEYEVDLTDDLTWTIYND
jgi:hypothetical protein